MKFSDLITTYAGNQCIQDHVLFLERQKPLGYPLISNIIIAKNF